MFKVKEEAFDVEDFILKLNTHQLGKKEIMFESYKTLDRLCKKVDVVKKVYSKYTLDLSKKETDLELSEVAYKNFLVLLVRYVECFKDYKFLNSALKLNTILLQRGFIEETEHTKTHGRLYELMTSMFN
jgi:hypothetical protein